jgi:hypothetical protein
MASVNDRSISTTSSDRRDVTRTATDTLSASPEAVWAILSDDFLEVSRWAGGVTSSVANPQTPNGVNGSPHGGRICEVKGLGTTDERIVEFDADHRTLAYVIRAAKTPFFVESMRSAWSVQPGTEPSTSLVTLTVQARTKGPFGPVGRIPLAKMLSGAAPGLLGDLKTHVEAGAGG